MHPGDQPLGRESPTPFEGHGMLCTTRAGFEEAKGQPHGLPPPRPALLSVTPIKGERRQWERQEEEKQLRAFIMEFIS